MSAARSAWLAALVACGPACAWEPAAPARRAQSVVNGAADAADPAVVAVVARRVRCDGPAPEVLCTGTLIAPRVVLTAAHCLDALGPDGAYEVFAGSALGASDGRYAVVSAAAVDPMYSARTHAHDVALLRLAQPLAIEPVSLALTPLDALVGQTARVVGFGTTNDRAMPAGTKREGTVRISEVTATQLRAVAAPAMSCSGDSGGPVLATVDGRERVVGVTGSGDAACTDYSLNARVDVLVDGFIRPFIEATAAMPAARGPEGIAAAALCTAGCASSDECPAAMVCQPQPGGPGRCVLPALGAGNFGAACGADRECAGPGAQCARIWPEGADACRCFAPCVPFTMPMTSPDASTPAARLRGGACALTPARPRSSAAVLLVCLSAVALARSRRRARRR